MVHKRSSISGTNSTDALAGKDGPEVLVAAAPRRPSAFDEVQTTETQLGFWASVKLYPGAVFWSLFMSLGVIMMSYDAAIVAYLFAVPVFQQQFGEYNPASDSYVLSAPWMVALTMGGVIGQVLGGLAVGPLLERFGRRKTLGVCVVLTAGLVFIQFFARSIKVLMVGELLGGLVLGTFCVIAPCYASEVCPVSLRGTLTAVTNITFVIGQLLATIVTRATYSLTTHWAYSIPFAVQWVWPVIILAGLPFCPESPWWLQRKGRMEEAERSLRRLASPAVDTKAALAVIVETDRLEQAMEAGSTYRDLFRGTNAVRTEIATGVYTIQVFSGQFLVGYATYFFELAGLPTEAAFNMSIGMLAVGLAATMLSWVLMSYAGRRAIYNWGLAGLTVILFVIGILDCVPYVPGVIWTQSSLLIVWNFVYDLTIGPVCFTLLGESSAVKFRAKTIAFATAFESVMAIGWTVAVPYAINPDQGNLRGKLGFIFGAFCIVGLVWAYFRLPETKGRTFEELDLMFERKVPLRKFKDYQFVGDNKVASAGHDE